MTMHTECLHPDKCDCSCDMCAQAWVAAGKPNEEGSEFRISHGRCHGRAPLEPAMPLSRRDIFALVALHAYISRGSTHDAAKAAALHADDLIEALDPAEGA